MSDDESPPWENLPTDLVRDITSRLGDIDRGRAEVICHAWRAAILEEGIPLLPPLRWFVVPRAGVPSNWRTERFFVLEKARRARYFGSYDGNWLFLSMDQARRDVLVSLDPDQAEFDDLPNVFRRGRGIPMSPDAPVPPLVRGSRIVIAAANLSCQPTEEGLCVAAGIMVSHPPYRDPRRIALWRMGDDAISRSIPLLLGEDVDLLYYSRSSNGGASSAFLTRGEHICCLPLQGSEDEKNDVPIILPCIPRVVYDQLHFPLGIDFYLTLVPALRASCLTVARRIAPDQKASDNYPYVAAVDQYGRLLLYATQGYPRRHDTFHPGPLGTHHGFDKAYFICDASSWVASRIPSHGRPILHPGNVGLISYPAKFFVAELQPNPTSFCITQSTTPGSTLRSTTRRATGHGAATAWCFTRVRSIWVDLSYGMLTCDLLYGAGESPEMKSILLPEGCELPAGTADLEKCRCVGIHEGCNGHPMVSMWTLIDEQAGECDIWEDELYRSTNLPASVPALALIDPVDDGDVVYFFLHSRLLAVDVRTGRVLEWQFFEMFHPPMEFHSSKLVRAWCMPEQSPDAETVLVSTSTAALPSPLVRELTTVARDMPWHTFLMMIKSSGAHTQLAAAW
uniref:DUF1618 domain-containing protein n=1 Tax=Leersia perrieri TaxID=77586 RepID=A0A0D9UZ05_9ORYZ